MNYGSVCSGIEAATVAWHPLGLKPVFFAEIEKFPSSVLKHHYRSVPNAGDFTAIKDGDHDPIDLLVGGTPCQDFSVAGLRAGMDGARGQLTVEFAHLAGRLRPRWLVWENVPGVLSIDGGRAFGTFLGLLGQLGYGFAYRVLDAQHFGVPQRRRRVFVVGHLGDWRRAAAVFFERHSLSGYPPPRREKGQVAPTIPSRSTGGGGLGSDFDFDFDFDGGLITAYGGNNCSGPIDIATAVNACSSASGRMDFESETFIAHSLRADGFDASEDGTGRGTPLVTVAAHTTGAGFWQEGFGTLRGREQDSHENLVAFSCKDHGSDVGETSPTLRAMGHDGSHANAGGQVAVAFQSSQSGVREVEAHATLDSNNGSRRHNGVMQGMAVRRLTPRECERLQGFPDDYTRISDKTADGPRYKALGNSMAVPVMRWIGERIQAVEAIR